MMKAVRKKRTKRISNSANRTKLKTELTTRLNIDGGDASTALLRRTPSNPIISAAPPVLFAITCEEWKMKLVDLIWSNLYDVERERKSWLLDTWLGKEGRKEGDTKLGVVGLRTSFQFWILIIMPSSPIIMIIN